MPFTTSLAAAEFQQEMLANFEHLTQQRDAAKNELEMARDTAKTYYQKMVQAESESSRIKTSMVASRSSLTLPPHR